MIDEATTRKGESLTRSFVVNKRNTAISLLDSVRINPREVGTLTWDDKLTLEFTGEAPTVKSIDIRPIEEADSVTTIFLCGNSTVVDQKDEPWTSWGQIFPAYFDKNIAISNHAESGERTSSFLASKRLDKVISMSHPGDWIIMEFGHNDEKDRGDGTGAWYNFATNLKIFIDRARRAGLNPILVTPTARRFFNQNGKLDNSHGDYPDAVRTIAEREGIPLVDLTEMTTILFETMGKDNSTKAFVHYPAGAFPGQNDALADNTHFNPFGATQIAKCVVESLREKVPDLTKHIVVQEKYDPSTPDNPENFNWTPAPFVDIQKPYGN
ncbi:MAG: rhamnogalacturonan acetylesterase [Muribaculum sp.]|nr:rhamnogalacturonan acetylesterase [Muribaculum sp.]